MKRLYYNVYSYLKFYIVLFLLLRFNTIAGKSKFGKEKAKTFPVNNTDEL